MNFEGLDPSLADYAAPLHPALEPVLDAHLPPSLLPNVELDAEGVPLEGMAVPEPVHLLEGMYSELHTAVSEVGVPVAASHFDLHEEMLWVGNHGVGAGCGVGERGAGSCSSWGCAAQLRSCCPGSEHQPPSVFPGNFAAPTRGAVGNGGFHLRLPPGLGLARARRQPVASVPLGAGVGQGGPSPAPCPREAGAGGDGPGPGCFQGHATSFFGPTLERYSSFRVNSSDDIRQIQSLENGVLFLTKTNLKYMSRGGLIIFDYL